ncbi:MAG: putative Target of rapamycin complex subunit LST8 [Streblomastix strix]|uniref:Putative Target of rapamycin complex subunit LST8 n=1 Tax=Streblomastix strix TaxID=222440 RepID=A0A5J4WVI0_9EUKA|nr:MAG: putative Target of rapamycin complex subunit LST8 [Streblomastix strix]
MNDVLIVAGGTDRQVDIWSVTRPVESKRLDATHANCIVFSEDKMLFYVGGYKLIQCFKRDSQDPIIRWNAHEGNILCLLSYQDNMLFSGAEDKKFIVWKPLNFQMGKSGQIFAHQFNSEVSSMTLDPTDIRTLFLSFQNGEIARYTLGSDTITIIKRPGPMVRSISSTRNLNFLFAADNEGFVYVYQTQTGELIKRFRAHDTYINKCVLSYDGMRLATCSSDHTAQVWSVPSLTNVSSTPELRWKHPMVHKRWVWDCVFTQDGKSLVTVSSDRSVTQFFEQSPIQRTLFERQRAAMCLALAEIDAIH